ncbi:cryptochrome/photolyase family protein [Aridibaculum aurantiacum]|uniref:cryptochrome/photolyase family protein n=1 Tax=Aridibaculum aurantiacum TaxID=2810307 RepID=UPI001A96D229|nr:deoxyribodipyrimidine photo-lyase [Aridibaculum aurantiacum]
MKPSINIFWFRRDLRLNDNAGLYHALKAGMPVLPIFIFDKHILDQLEDKHDKRVSFIYQAVLELQTELEKHQSSLHVHYAEPLDVFKQLSQEYNVQAVFTNHDYEPYALQRDAAIKELLQQHGCSFFSYKDHVIFEKDEVMKPAGGAYTVFTPYSRVWLKKLDEFYLSSYPVDKYLHRLYQQPSLVIPTLQQMGFEKAEGVTPPKQWKREIIKDYHATRDLPAVAGTSQMGVHLRFGTISIRHLAKVANETNATYLSELIWREFYQAILWHFPHVGQGLAFKPAYDKIPWRHNEADFERWCNGTTGYPIVDAGMRELNETGFMHNRIRMVTASFLTKHLLIDWRWGEAYFAQKLLDYEFASNNGGWQWAAGSGCDAAPYFRIFNPYLQTKKFDKDLVYVRKWVPEFEDFSYPKPMVEHEVARKRALQVYGEALKPS